MYEDLITRLDSAVRGDRSIDASLFRVFGAETAATEPYATWILRQEAGRDDYLVIPQYSTSLTDIVIEIKTHGFLWAAHEEPKVFTRGCVWPKEFLWQDVDFEADATTPELALCIALLMALEVKNAETH